MGLVWVDWLLNRIRLLEPWSYLAGDFVEGFQVGVVRSYDGSVAVDGFDDPVYVCE